MVSYEIDGRNFSTLEGFFDEIERILPLDAPWGSNLDAFDEVLVRGYGMHDDGFELVWRNHALSISRLGYPETVRQLEKRLESCHPANRELVARQLTLARTGRGPTVFDWLLEIIKRHGAGGSQAADQVLLSLR